MAGLRIGFAGAGFIAETHASGLAQRRDAEIAAVFDPSEAKAEALAGMHGASAVASFEALLEGVEAVFICAPNNHHAALAIEALEAGKHVFSEKPMAISPAEARRVREAAERAKGVYQVGFNKHFAAVYRAVKKKIDSGELTPAWASIKMNRGELLRPSWVGDASITGGFLYETPIHVLELSTWLFGPAREVVCRARSTSGGQLDDFAMVLTFASGLSATLVTSAHATWHFPYERLEVYGDHATAVTEEMERVTFQIGLDASPETLDVSHLPMPERWGYAAEGAAFLAAARGEQPVAVGAAEGEAAVLLVDACYRAAETQQAIALE